MTINARSAALSLRNSCAPWRPPTRCYVKNAAVLKWKNRFPAAPFHPGGKVKAPEVPVPPIPAAAVRAATAALVTEYFALDQESL